MCDPAFLKVTVEIDAIHLKYEGKYYGEMVIQYKILGFFLNIKKKKGGGEGEKKKFIPSTCTLIVFLII